MHNVIFIHVAILDKYKEKILQYLDIIENSKLSFSLKNRTFIFYIKKISLCFEV